MDLQAPFCLSHILLVAEWVWEYARGGEIGVALSKVGAKVLGDAGESITTTLGRELKEPWK